MGTDIVELDIHLSLDKDTAAGWMAILQAEGLSPGEFVASSVKDAVRGPTSERVFRYIIAMDNGDRERLIELIEGFYDR